MRRREPRDPHLLSPSTRPATLADVAQAAGVSTTTASFVLNGRASAIPAATRARVHEAASTLRYAKSAMITALQQGRSQALGIHFDATRMTFPADPIMARTLAGIAAAGQTSGHHLVLYTGLPASETGPPVEAFLDRRVDGLILIAPPVDSGLVTALAETYLPCAVLFSHRVPETLAYVDADNRQGARLAVEHLHALGHRRIAHLAGRRSSSNFLDRREGYQSALSDLGLPWDGELEVTLDADSDHQAVLRALLTLPDPPTAVFCYHDSCAVQVVQAAAVLGVAVPDEFSVVGFDDGIVAATASPALTTVRQPFEELGRCAGAALADLLQGAAVAEQRRLIPVELVVRGSTAPVRRRQAARRNDR